MPASIDRRDFIAAGAAATAVNILPSHVYALSPNGKFRTAHVGVGGKGWGDLNSMASHAKCEVAGICDVDSRNLEKAATKFPNAKKFRDYREMLESLGDSIDGVIVSTPDHTHAPASMRALNMGKTVYCQKPLTHEVSEARQLRLVAENKKLATQMGIQVHSSREYRMATQLIQSGVIGKVSKVYAWSYKNWGNDGAIPTGEDPVPETLDWNLWVGSAPMRPYKKGVYHPGNWRRLIDFGCGTLGDMGVHIFDTPFRACALKEPLWVKTTCRPPTGFGHPTKNTVEYEFQGTEFTTKTMLWTWFDGKGAPPKDNPDLALPANWKLPNQGAMFIGEDDKKMLLPHVGAPRLFPEESFKGYKYPKLPNLDHYHQWIDASLGETKCSADFTYAGRLTEALLLGIVANRYPNTKLEWDAKALKVTNISEANALIKRKYRDGFGAKNL